MKQLMSTEFGRKKEVDVIKFLSVLGLMTKCFSKLLPARMVSSLKIILASRILERIK